MNVFEQIRSALEGINPNAPGALLMLCSWLGTYAARKWLPVQWAALTKWGAEGGKLEHVLGALPGLVASAAIAALWANSDPWLAATDAFKAALAPLLHHVLKLAPVPYRGAMGEKVSGPESRRRIVADIE